MPGHCACRLSTGKADRDARVSSVLAELGLARSAGLRIAALSGGQRKRANVAVELLAQPDVVVLDEPTAGLDPGYERSVITTLRELADGGRTVLAVTHSMAALAVCDRVLFLAAGGQVAFFGLLFSGAWVSAATIPGLTQLSELSGAHWGVKAVEATLTGDAQQWWTAIVVLLLLTAGMLAAATLLLRRRLHPTPASTLSRPTLPVSRVARHATGPVAVFGASMLVLAAGMTVVGVRLAEPNAAVAARSGGQLSRPSQRRTSARYPLRLSRWFPSRHQSRRRRDRSCPAPSCCRPGSYGPRRQHSKADRSHLATTPLGAEPSNGFGSRRPPTPV